MSDLLREESPRQVLPELATWIGLNEAIFLQQLHFILVKIESVGQWADGRKWYRDKPHDFVVKYFPFWDEGIVKRTIDNLRSDGLILARSDLNKIKKDRSLWYTVNYEAIERLSGPVERILNKSAKRKEARQARKPREDSSNEYTKVQNVLLNNDKGEQEETGLELTEVQIVPDIKSTKCTSDLGTKCTSEKVQIVPIPKDSLSKESLPKDKTPKGVGGESPPAPVGPKTRVKDKFLELTHLAMPTAKSDSKFWWGKFGEILKLAGGDSDLACKWQGEVVGYMGVNHLPITGPQSIVGLIRALASGQSLNGGHLKNGNDQRNSGPLSGTGESLEGKPTYNKYTKELIYPDGRRVPAVS